MTSSGVGTQAADTNTPLQTAPPVREADSSTSVGGRYDQGPIMPDTITLPINPCDSVLVKGI